MEIGHIVDFCIEWNEQNKVDEDTEATNGKKKEKPKKRKATQADWDALMGG